MAKYNLTNEADRDKGLDPIGLPILRVRIFDLNRRRGAGNTHIFKPLRRIQSKNTPRPSGFDRKPQSAAQTRLE